MEVCVDSVESAIAAQAGGASRLELCEALVDGGVTPSLGKVRAVLRAVRIPVHVIIRPRGGDMLYNAAELAIMMDDIAILKREGAHGVVVGVLDADGAIDVTALRQLIEAARPMRVCFHRAIDVCRDMVEAYKICAAEGVDFVLTSGGSPTAMGGAATIRALVQSAKAGSPVVVAGGGVTPDNAVALVAATGVTQLHATARQWHDGGMRFRRLDPLVPMGGAKAVSAELEYGTREASAEVVAAIAAALTA